MNSRSVLALPGKASPGPQEIGDTPQERQRPGQPLPGSNCGWLAHWPLHTCILAPHPPFSAVFVFVTEGTPLNYPLFMIPFGPQCSLKGSCVEVVKHDLGGRRQWGLNSSAPPPLPPTPLELWGVHLEGCPIGQPLRTSHFISLSRLCGWFMSGVTAASFPFVACTGSLDKRGSKLC